MNLEIRHLHTPEEAALAARLQREIWGNDETPAHVLLTAAHNGGLCAGAFVDDTLAGFVWGFLGLDDRTDPPRLKHCSHQLGVHPAHRNLGLGFALKRFQWEFVRAHGLGLVTWTYDPLLATNAQLNIARLGAVCNTYHRDEYGELNDDLNAGLPTDRFQVDLWVDSARVRAAMQARSREAYSLQAALWFNPPSVDGQVVPPDATHLAAMQDDEDRSVVLAIPLDFQAGRGADTGLAAAWRYATRDAFCGLFERQYTVVDFVRRPGFGYYVLVRSWDSSAPG
jgi:predicted GNAT superfamily acetyltransferase